MPWLHSTLPKENWASLCRQECCSFPRLLPAAPSPGAGQGQALLLQENGLTAPGAKLEAPWSPPCPLPSPLIPALQQFPFLSGLWVAWAGFPRHFPRHWDLHREIPAGWSPLLWGAWGRQSCSSLQAQHPAATVSQGKRKELVPLPLFLYSKQLELGTARGSATLAPAAIEFPLLVSLASASFTFCKVASLLPCTD